VACRPNRAAPPHRRTQPPPFSKQTQFLVFLFYAENEYGIRISKRVFKSSRSEISCSEILRRKRDKELLPSSLQVRFGLICVAMVICWHDLSSFRSDLLLSLTFLVWLLGFRCICHCSGSVMCLWLRKKKSFIVGIFQQCS